MAERKGQVYRGDHGAVSILTLNRPDERNARLIAGN
jgi:enoyl-CoA hydratase/carnithine racemase